MESDQPGREHEKTVTMIIMKTRDRARHLLVVLIFLMLTGCDSCEKYSDGPEIEWLNHSYLTYNYRLGVVTGFSAHVKFIVTSSTSGEIKMTAEYEGQGKSCTGFVEPGKEYEAVVICSISSTTQDGEVIIDSPTAPNPFTIKTDVKTGVSSITIKEL